MSGFTHAYQQHGIFHRPICVAPRDDPPTSCTSPSRNSSWKSMSDGSFNKNVGDISARSITTLGAQAVVLDWLPQLQHALELQD